MTCVTIPSAYIHLCMNTQNNFSLDFIIMIAQTELQTHIDRVVTDGARPSMTLHKAKLPLVQAAILEVHRLASTVPLVLHTSMADTNILQYSVKKDDRVIANTRYIHHDPELWENPECFNPHRFIDNQGKLCNTEQVLAFSIGMLLMKAYIRLSAANQ